MGRTRKVKSNKKVIEAYAKCNGNIGKTAALLGIDRTTLWKMQQVDQALAQAMSDRLEATIDNMEESATIMAQGIPKMEWVDVKNKVGEVIDTVWKQTGWLQPPDARFAKMLLDAKAKNRGYGKMEIDLGAQEGTQLLTTVTVVRRGTVTNENGSAAVVVD